MPSLQDVLGGVPFLSGYQQQSALNQQQGAQQLQQVGQVMNIQQAMQQQAKQDAAAQREAQYRAEIQGLGPNPTQEQLATIGSRYASPDKLMDIQQKSIDRKTQLEQTASQFAQNLQLRQDELERKREEFNQRATDQKARDEFNQWYKQESLKNQQYLGNLNAQLRMQGLEIQRQGQQLQISRLDQAQNQQRTQKVQQLSTALDKANVPEASAVLAAAEKALNETPELAGFIAGPKGKIPDAMVGLASGNANKIREGRQAFQKLFNITLRDRSGAAVTMPEFERLKAEFGNGLLSTPDQIKTGLQQAKRIIQQHAGSIAAGFGPDALGAYNENARTLGGVEIGGAPSIPDAPPPGAVRRKQ